MKQFLSTLNERFEAMAMAVAFAEAGEWETAERIIDRNKTTQTKRTGKKDRRTVDNRPRMRV